jgi:hypothetical protein
VADTANVWDGCGAWAVGDRGAGWDQAAACHTRALNFDFFKILFLLVYVTLTFLQRLPRIMAGLCRVAPRIARWLACLLLAQLLPRPPCMVGITLARGCSSLSALTLHCLDGFLSFSVGLLFAQLTVLTLCVHSSHGVDERLLLRDPLLLAELCTLGGNHLPNGLAGGLFAAEVGTKPSLDLPRRHTLLVHPTRRQRIQP